MILKVVGLMDRELKMYGGFIGDRVSHLKGGGLKILIKEVSTRRGMTKVKCAYEK